MTFRVYRDASAGLHVFKRGFAWQAFILPEIWLFLRGLPIDALVWIILMISALVSLPQLVAGLALLVARVGVRLVAWRRLDRLYRSKGWTHLTDVHAPSLLNALMTVRCAPGRCARSVSAIR